MNATFILDERWVINALNAAPDSIETLEYITNLVDEINNKSNPLILCSADIYEKDCSNQQLCEVIFGDLIRHPLCRDELLRLSTLLDTLEKFDIELDDDTVDSDALSILKKYGEGALIYNKEVTDDWWIPESMMIVDRKDKIEKYYRIKAVNKNIPFTEFSCHLPDLFPSLYFHSEAKDFSKLGVSHELHLKTIVKHLSYLNDDARNHFLEDGSNFNRIASSHGVNLSGESTNTRGNHRASRERCRIIANTELKFELHTKITWGKGRIHFHIGNNLPESVSNITQGKIIIGILCEHLQT